MSPTRIPQVQDLERRRLEHALAVCNRFNAEPADDLDKSGRRGQRDKLTSIIPGGALFVRQCGLLQTLAVWTAKGESRPLALELVSWLTDPEKGHPFAPIIKVSEDGVTAFVHAGVKADRASIRQAEWEALAWLSDLKLAWEMTRVEMEQKERKPAPAGLDEAKEMKLEERGHE